KVVHPGVPDDDEVARVEVFQRGAVIGFRHQGANLRREGEKWGMVLKEVWLWVSPRWGLGVMWRSWLLLWRPDGAKSSFRMQLGSLLLRPDWAWGWLRLVIN
ncbi:MAG: hypothetical protein ACKOAR_05715, partial [Bacteroidota bacterium]